MRTARTTIIDSMKAFAVSVFALLLLAGCAQATPTGTVSSSGTTTVAPTEDATAGVDDSETGTTVETHEEPTDFQWDAADEIAIAFDGTSIETAAASAEVDGTTVTLTSAGTYRLAGTLTDGQVVVDADDAIVRLILDGVDITNDSGPAVAVAGGADKVIVVLAEGSENHVADGSSYSEVETDLNAALMSKSDLSVGGSGSLTVDGNFNDGIASTDGLVIADGKIVVNAVDDGIRGKDYLVVTGGDLTVDAGGDGLKSDNAEDEGAGSISITAGVVTIVAGGDAIQASNALEIAGGTFDLVTRSGSDTDSAKGLKAGESVVIDGGTFSIDTIDDAIHSNGTITIDDGVFAIATGDDGMHADASLTINGGTTDISGSYEGLESAVIAIEGGSIAIVSSDDGINVVGGNDESGFRGGPPGGGPPGDDAFASSSDYWLYVDGGTVLIDAGGDGIDINGSVAMSGGTIIIHGPTANNNGALDVNGSFEVSGGYLVAAGSAGMAESPDATSEQSFLALQFNGTQQAESLVQIQAEDGTILLSFTSSKPYQSLVFSSPDLISGGSYDVYVGGEPTGTGFGGVYEMSTTSGTSVGSVTAS